MFWRKLLSGVCLVLLSAALLACGSSNSSNKTAPVAPPPAGPDTASPPPQGSRILGMDVKDVPAVSYDTAYKQAMAMGVREVSVSLDWGLLEPLTGTYDNTLPDVIDAYYPLQQGDITLVLRPLDTPGPRLPGDLSGNYDNPAVIAAFENFLTNLHSRLPGLNASGKLRWIHVGNEIDAWLGSDVNRWTQWQTFFNAAKAKIESLWGAQVNVSSIVQFGVLTDSGKKTRYLDLLSSLDSAVLTYYPLAADFSMRSPDTVAADFQIMVDAISNKTILLQECGYASGALNNSSEALQADFISAVFSAWDRHRDRIGLIDIAWQYDVDEATADQWVIDFGLSGQPNADKFKSYLWTLGLSNHDGSEKLALQRLREELQARGWAQ